MSAAGRLLLGLLLGLNGLLVLRAAPHIQTAVALVAGSCVFAALARRDIRPRILVWCLIGPALALGFQAFRISRYAWALRAPLVKGTGEKPRLDQRGLNLLLITVDTLRRDAIEPFGHVSTPAAARLARMGTSFSAAYSQSNHTPPSLAGLMSATHPAFLATEGDSFRLPSTMLPAERFRASGLATAAIFANFGVVHGGILRGFDSAFGIHHKDASIERNGRSFREPWLDLSSQWSPGRAIPDTTAAVAEKAAEYLQNQNGRNTS